MVFEDKQWTLSLCTVDGYLDFQFKISYGEGERRESKKEKNSFPVKATGNKSTLVLHPSEPVNYLTSTETTSLNRDGEKGGGVLRWK